MSALDPRVGLEVHVRLATRSKLFCACPSQPDAEPNANTCPVCAGLPGAMPTLNRRAVELALTAALVLDCQIAPVFAFDRKHYAYPDLPKGYQTTQARLPLARGGQLVLNSGERVALIGLHLEDDAGRSRHDARSTQVDLGRAGAPLIEIVTEPQLKSPEQVTDFLRRLREELRFSRVSDCDMEKGSMRVDVNVSVTPGDPRVGTPGSCAANSRRVARVELKNLNSIRAAGEAVESEFARQTQLLEAQRQGRGSGPVSETRGWHARSKSSFAMRTKEHATDYRFLPEPDLPPVGITSCDLEALKSAVPEGPRALRKRYIGEHGLTPGQARAMTKTPARAHYFEAGLACGAPPRPLANWITNDLAAAARERGRRDLKALMPASELAALLALEECGALSQSATERVFAALLDGPSGRSPKGVARELGLLQDPAQRQAMERAACDRAAEDAIAGDPRSAADYRGGKQAALDALVGAAMRSSQGQLDGARVRAALLRALDR